MSQYIKLVLISLGLALSPGIGFAAECNTSDMPEELFQLIKKGEMDEALNRAKATYANDKKDKVAAFVLARVYINATLRSGVNFDLSKLGFKPGEKGSKSVTMEMLKKATSDGFTVDPAYYEEADKFVQSVVERWPEARDFYYCLTKIHFYSGNQERFIASLAKTAELQKHNEDEAVDFLMTYGTDLVRKNDFRRAARVYQVLLKTFPESVPLLSSLGVTAVKRGRTKQGMEYFDKAHQNDPEDIIVIGNYAEAAMLLGDFRTAEEFLLKKAEYLPNKADIYFDLAMNAIHAGPESSLPYWERYFKVHARHPDDEAWAKNAEKIQSAVNNAPDDLTLWQDLAYQMVNYRVPKYAIPVLSYVKQHKAHDAEVVYTMAQAYSVGSHLELEEEALLETLRRLDDPKNTYQIERDEIYYNLSRTTYLLEKYDNALDYLNRISSDTKNPARADYMYGLVYRARGDKEKAGKYFQSCIDKADGESIEQYCRGQLE